MPLADTLLRLGGRPRIYRPIWTAEIMNEVNRNLAKKFGLTNEQVEYRESEIRRTFPDTWVEGHRELIISMTNHPKDRHVLAAAVASDAKIIVGISFNH